MATRAKGTFSTAGQSANVVGRAIDIQMTFASTGSVNVERLMRDGSWLILETVTAGFNKIFDSPVDGTLRLNCTAASGNIVYSMYATQLP